MANKATYFTSENQPQNRRSRKGSPNMATTIQRMYELQYQKEIQKQKKDGTFKNIKLSAIEYIVGADLKMLDDEHVAPQIKAKIVNDLLPYLFKKESEKVEVEMNANVDVNKLTREELYKMVFENNGTEDTEAE